MMECWVRRASDFLLQACHLSLFGLPSPPAFTIIAMKVISSKRVPVLFAGNNYLIINPAPDDPNGVDRVEVSRDAIKAIVWCRDKKPTKKAGPS